MHEDRDHYIILITLLPFVVFIGLYVLWRSAGEPPIGAPNLPLPVVSLPAVPDLSVYVPDWIKSMGAQLRNNGDTVFPAIGVGLLVGVVGTGVIIDACKVVWKRVTKSTRPTSRTRKDGRIPPGVA